MQQSTVAILVSLLVPITAAVAPILVAYAKLPGDMFSSGGTQLSYHCSHSAVTANALQTVPPPHDVKEINTNYRLGTHHEALQTRDWTTEVGRGASSLIRRQYETDRRSKLIYTSTSSSLRQQREGCGRAG